MSPLTSSPGCECCLLQRQKIKQLEERISLLHQIKEDEELLDRLAASGEAPPADRQPIGLLEEQPVVPAVPGAGPVVSMENWPTLGAKPKEPWIPARHPKPKRDRKAVSPPIPLGNSFELLNSVLEDRQSTPRAKRRRRRGKVPSPPAVPREIDPSLSLSEMAGSGSNKRLGVGTLSRQVGGVDPSPRTEVKGVVPDRRGCTRPAGDGDLSLHNEVETVVPGRRGRTGTHPATAHVNPAHPSSTAPVLLQSRPAAASQLSTVHTRAKQPPSKAPLSTNKTPRPGPDLSRRQQRGSPPPPSVLVIGDSIARSIRIVNGLIYCYPGANTEFILSRLPTILASIPPSISKIVLHVAVNDRPSVDTRKNFKNIFDLLLSCGKHIFLSGPIPPLYAGESRFSRLLDLHYWLQSVCSSCNITYIHNFHLFWSRRAFYRHDCLHPSTLGSHSLSFHIQRILDTHV